MIRFNCFGAILMSVILIITTPCVPASKRDTSSTTTRDGTITDSERHAIRKLQNVSSSSSLQTLDDIVLTDPDLTTLKDIFERSGLVGALDLECNYTIFIPINDAFGSFDTVYLQTLLLPNWIVHLQDFLSFMVTVPTDNQRIFLKDYVDGQVFDTLNGEVITANILPNGNISLSSPLTVNGSNIVEGDIVALNGVLNKIDTVMIPGFFGNNVFTLGQTNDTLTMFEDLLNLVRDDINITNEEAYTIFPPINNAFIALGNETLSNLMNNKTQLQQVIENHIVLGVYPSTMFTEDDEFHLQTINGFNLSIILQNEDGYVNGVLIERGNVDIVAKNGIAHALNMVLLSDLYIDDGNNSMASISSPGMKNETTSDSSTIQQQQVLKLLLLIAYCGVVF
jgi:transforming growth factor-beta-induced protein